VLLASEVLPITSSVGVAASTLTAAALFNPLRRRIQRLGRPPVQPRPARRRGDGDRLQRPAAAGDRPQHHQRRAAPGVERALAPAQASIWINPNRRQRRSIRR